MFISIDDKHRIKIGEPGYPVAAVGGREAIVSQSQIFAVGNHDFTKFSLIPSVVLQINILENFEGYSFTVMKDWITCLLMQLASSRKEDVASTLKPTIDLLKSIFTCLELKGEPFDLYEIATDEEIHEFWSVLLLIDSTITIDTTTKQFAENKSCNVQVY